MITDAILDMIEASALWLASLLPSSDLDPVAHLGTVLDNLGALNYFLPIAEVVSLVVGVLVVFPAFMGVTLAVWLIALLRGGSARA